VTSDAWRERAAGVVSYVAQEAVAPTQSSPNRAPTFQVKVELEGVHKDLPLNVPATAEIVVETVPDALLVPYSCVRHLPNGQGTLRESANGTVREHTVKLGAITAGKVQIIGEVAEGTRVVGCGRASADATRTVVER
jgi:hypothetical protein